MRHRLAIAVVGSLGLLTAASPALATNTNPVVKSPLKFTASKPNVNNCAKVEASDPDGDPLTYRVVLQPRYGDASMVGNQVCYLFLTTYYNINDSFNVEVTDGFGGRANVSVEVFVPAAGLTLKGDDKPNRLVGKGGPDKLFGFGDNDVLDGQSGPDEMDGGKGDDTYNVDNADDVVIDEDPKSKVRTTVSYTLPVSAGPADVTIVAKGKINARGNRFYNVLTGNDEANILDGKAGDDVLAGLGGPDKLVGDKRSYDTADYRDSPRGVKVDLRKGTGDGGDAEGDKLISMDSIYGSRFDDVLSGTPLANYMDGGKGNDRLFGLGVAGTRRDDILIGGPDGDIMEGGKGRTLFRIKRGDSKPNSADTVNGFLAEGDNHVIDLNEYRDDRGRVLFDKFIGAAPFSGKRGEVRFANGRLEGDEDGDKRPDLLIFIKVKTGTFAEADVQF